MCFMCKNKPLLWPRHICYASEAVWLRAARYDYVRRPRHICYGSEAVWLRAASRYDYVRRHASLLEQAAYSYSLPV
jgi:hypothetical protein